MSTRNSESGRVPEDVGRSKPGHDESSATFGAFVRKPGARHVAVDISSSKTPQGGIESVEALPDDAVELGFIADAYGLKGWVKIVPHANGKQGGDALLNARRWWLVKGRDYKSARCMQSKVHADTIVARFAGCDDRDTALALKGHTVNIARSDFPKLDSEDEFYWVDLIGLNVESEAGVALGRVADLIDNGAHSILRIEYPSTDKDGKPVTGERLIPFVGVYVKTVDRAAKRIVVDWDADY
ncbi:ribosome maturation factor RimM [Caballeronia novacaledonica]|uniref:ribosome maturation factor RimM n=1 Tax=Caballeronia novacaledonica TaxID=1544861 RepID=UPI001EE19AB0|nr:ribosome maturation factor RimM [Caballeronia novacaledonica]GJH09390.1 ribosome maturation factor RimM [Caballeronia novacaledonica]